MIYFQEFSSDDGQDKFQFLKKADLQAKGFKIVGMFEDAKTVEQMQEIIKELRDQSEQDPCKQKFFWIKEKTQLIGVITLRPALNGFWLHNAGHIGIAIDKPFRRQHYGTESLKKMCEKANTEYGIKDLIIMSLVDNIPSRTMIEKSGGEYLDTITASDGAKLARYWIKSE